MLPTAPPTALTQYSLRDVVFEICHYDIAHLECGPFPALPLQCDEFSAVQWRSAFTNFPLTCPLHLDRIAEAFTGLCHRPLDSLPCQEESVQRQAKTLVEKALGSSCTFPADCATSTCRDLLLDLYDALPQNCYLPQAGAKLGGFSRQAIRTMFVRLCDEDPIVYDRFMNPAAPAA